MNLLCALHWSLAFLAMCSSAYESGIQYSVPYVDLVAVGCSECYKAILTSNTKSSHITSCSGPYLFVGIQSLDNVTFEVGAYAPAVEVQQHTTLNNPHYSNGLYWQFEDEKVFGFSMSRDGPVRNVLDSGRGHESHMSLASASAPARELFWSLEQTNIRVKNFRPNSLGTSPLNQVKWILNCPAPLDAMKHEEAAAVDTDSSSPTDIESFESAIFSGPSCQPTAMPSRNHMKYTFQPTVDKSSSHKSMLEPLVVIVVSTFAPGILCILMVVSVWYKRHWCELLEATQKEIKEPSGGMGVRRIMRIAMHSFTLFMTLPFVALPLLISYCKRRSSSVGNAGNNQGVGEEGGRMEGNVGGDINQKEKSTEESAENPCSETLI